MYILEIKSLISLLFSRKESVELLMYHRRWCQEDDVISDVMDSHLWDYLKRHEPSVMEHSRNLFFALSTDGTLVKDCAVQLDGTRGQYSVWPIVLVCYNLPPWLRYLFGFLFVVGLVDRPQPGPIGVMCALEVIVDQFLDLYRNGHKVWNELHKTDEVVKAMLVKMIADFKALYKVLGVLGPPSEHGCFSCRCRGLLVR